MPRRLALCLLIAWLAWVPVVLAQLPDSATGPGQYYQGTPSAYPYPGPHVPTEYRLQPTLQEQLLPPSRGTYFDADPLHDLGLFETVSHSWIRAEYLWMNYRDPRGQLIGAKPLVVPPATFDRDAFLPAFDRVTGVRPFQSAHLTTFEDGHNRDNSGFRLTMGIPTQLFTFEASGFVMGESESRLSFPTFIDVNDILGNTVVPAIPLLRDGLPSGQDFILFDQGMNVDLSSNIQGTDVKFVLGALTPNTGLDVLPVIGFNYLHYGNRMTISGGDDGTSTSHLIGTKANNNIFGPELGLRMEARSRWITLGVEPKLTFGINRISNHLRTSQIFTAAVDPITLAPLEPDFAQKDTQTRFSPMIDLSSYARIRLAEGLNATLGYQFMATTNVSRSENNVYWNSSSLVTLPPLIRLKEQRETFWMHGINLGLEWQF